MDPHPSWTRVGYQGEPGAYSEEAAIAVLPKATTVGFPTFTRAFDALASREVDAAVLQVENSLGGIVQEVNDLLWETPGLSLTREYVHPIRHCLLGRAGSEVNRAISQPEALGSTKVARPMPIRVRSPRASSWRCCSRRAGKSTAASSFSSAPG